MRSAAKWLRQKAAADGAGIIHGRGGAHTKMWALGADFFLWMCMCAMPCMMVLPGCATHLLAQRQQAVGHGGAEDAGAEANDCKHAALVAKVQQALRRAVRARLKHVAACTHAMQ